MRRIRKMSADRMAEHIKQCVRAEAARCGGLYRMDVMRNGSTLLVFMDDRQYAVQVVALPKEGKVS